MADKPISYQKMVDMDKDADTLKDAVNGNKTGIVTPRLNDPYSTLPAALNLIEEKGRIAIQKLENTGGFISRATLAELNATTPEYDYQLARVDATGDEYRWNPALTTTVKWEPTGRNFLSESKALIDKENAILGFQISDLDLINTITESVTKTLEKTTLSVLDSFNSTSGTAKSVLTVDDVTLNLLPAESIQNGLKITPYQIIKLNDMAIYNVTTDTNNMVSVNFTASLLNPFSSISAFSAWDLNGDFNATSQSLGAAGDYTKKYVLLHQNSFIRIIIPLSDLTSAGYAATAASVKSYLNAFYTNTVINYRTTVSTAIKTKFYKITNIHENSVSASVVNGAFSLSLYQRSAKVDTNSLSVIAEESALNSYVADVKNNTSENFTEIPIELKIQFKPSEVFSHDCIRVLDNDGNVYECQFAPEYSVNLRKGLCDGYYADGSFNVGSVLFYANIAAGVTKQFLVESFGSKSQFTMTPSKLTKTSLGYAITQNGYTFNFNTSSNFQLASIVKNAVAQICAFSFTSIQYLNSLRTEIGLALTPTIKVINEGSLFTEIEIENYLTASAILTAGQLKGITRYRIFKDGTFVVRSLFKVISAIDVNKLLGYRTSLHFNSTIAVTSNVDGVIIYPESFNSTEYTAIVHQTVNGDIHRDGQAYGPSRPIVEGFPTRRSYLGFEQSVSGGSFDKYPFLKDWTWTTERWVFMGLTSSETTRTLSKKVHNRLVGFCGDRSSIGYKKAKAVDIASSLLDLSSKNFFYANTVGVTKSTKTAYQYPQSLHFYEVMTGSRTLQSAWDLFKAYLDRNYGSYLTLGDRYTSGGILMQYGIHYIVKPVYSAYAIAKAMNNTTVLSDIGLLLNNFAFALAAQANTKGFIPLVGTSTAVPALNACINGLLPICIAINAGLDNANKDLANAVSVIKTFISSNNADKVLPIRGDDMGGSTSSFAANHWLGYDLGISEIYSLCIKMLNNGEIWFDDTNLFLSATTAQSDFREIDYCISESRRGNVSADSLATFFYLNTISAYNVCIKSLERSLQIRPNDPTINSRAHDFDGYVNGGASDTGSNAAFTINSLINVLLDDFYS